MLGLVAENLLNNISLITDKHIAIAKATGANFNIFSVLRMQSDEERLHSRFIRELLDPQGKHEQGATFLKLFIQILKLPVEEYIDLDRSCIIAEEYIGKIDEKYNNGGKIDLVMKFDTGKSIIIENKIFAPDQPKQLVRYRNKYPNFHLYYLTLDGKLPNAFSAGTLSIDEHYKCISYSVQIIDWLTACIKETATRPMIRETIIQYMNTINSLTGQSSNSQRADEIVDVILKSGKNVEAAFAINNLSRVKEKLAAIFKLQMKELAEERGLELTYKISSFENLWEGFTFGNKDLDQDCLAILFNFHQPLARKFSYGIMITKYETQENGEKVLRNFRSLDDHMSPLDFLQNKLSEFKNITQLEHSGYVSCAFNYFMGIENWRGKEFGEIVDGTMKKRIEEKLDLIIQAFKLLNPEKYKFCQ